MARLQLTYLKNIHDLPPEGAYISSLPIQITSKNAYIKSTYFQIIRKDWKTGKMTLDKIKLGDENNSKKITTMGKIAG